MGHKNRRVNGTPKHASQGKSGLKPRKPPVIPLYDPEDDLDVDGLGESVLDPGELGTPDRNQAGTKCSRKLADRGKRRTETDEERALRLAKKPPWKDNLEEEEEEDEEDEDLDDEEDDAEDDDQNEEDEVLDDEDDDWIPSPPPEAPAPEPKVITDADFHADYLSRLNARRKRTQSCGLVGIPTGLPALDEATGGLQGCTVLAGPTTSGKTSLAGAICLAALQQDAQLAVLYLLLDDMTPDQLQDQLICNVARIDYLRYVSDSLPSEEMSRIEEADTWLQKVVRPRMETVKLNQMYDGLPGGLIFSWAKDLAASVGATRVLTVIDMLDDLPTPRLRPHFEVQEDCHREYQRRVHRIEADPGPWRLEQVLDLKRRSEEVCPGGWPILLIGKLRKSLSRNEEPTLDDLLGGVDLAYKTQRVIFLLPQQDKADTSTVPVTLSLKKQRHGRSLRLPLRFHYTQFRFEELAASTQKEVNKKTKAKGAGKGKDKPLMSVDPLDGMNA